MEVPRVLEESTSMSSSDLWTDSHVKLPSSTHSTVEIMVANVKTRVKRWNLIVQALSQAENWKSVDDLISAILSYNDEHSVEWSFHGLRKYFKAINEEKRGEIFSRTLPKIAKLALSLPNVIKRPIPLLTINMNESVTLSSMECSILLANAFFCTFPARNACSMSTRRSGRYENFPNINFNCLYGFGNITEKMKCLMHYFQVITSEQSPSTAVPTRSITFERRSERTTAISWISSSHQMPPLDVQLSGRIEDTVVNSESGQSPIAYCRHAYADFANAYLGGGVLGGGQVQEEILFVIYPECLVGMLLCEKMEDNEAIVIYGAKRFSDYSGYANTFKWMMTSTVRDTMGVVETLSSTSNPHLSSRIVAIDATAYGSHRRRAEQFSVRGMNRELRKAVIGFQGGDWDKVATGHWGCGAFRGDKYLKATIQLLACSHANKSLIYYAFGEHEFAQNLQKFHAFLVQKKISSGLLYNALITHDWTNLSGRQVFAELWKALESAQLLDDAVASPMSDDE